MGNTRLRYATLLTCYSCDGWYTVIEYLSIAGRAAVLGW
jgi:hypothetical protein